MNSYRLYLNTSGLQHNTGAHHPECIERLEALQSLFQDMELSIIAPQPVDFEKLCTAHPQSYVTAIQEAVPDHGTAHIDGDTILSPRSWEAIEDAASQAINAAEAVCQGAIKAAFCAGRPPGHHAEPAQAMGFCFINNAAVAALHALQQPGINRVAIIDFDVHHGNGTDTITRQHDGLFYASTHQWPLFPGTGHEDDNLDGKIINRTLTAGDGTEAFQAAYTDHIFPAIEQFAPDLIIISAGFDAHKDDPLGGLDLTEDDFIWITKELMHIADTHCDGKIVSVLEGGYNLEALKSSVKAHISTLFDL
jgi:acetoin utilization deacetylase AcuC-like enzyme